MPSFDKHTLKAYWQIARPDHWIKNVFVFPGVAVALSIDHSAVQTFSWTRLLFGLIAVCLITSSNYVLNEILDAPSDRKHPTKHNRPVPSGRVNISAAYIEWIALFALGLIVGSVISKPFSLTMAALWVAGCLYNIPPLRTKDVPYLDVLSEAVNNPLRMLAGWYLTTTNATPTLSLLVSYWMIGCYFMAIKRYAEYREIADVHQAAAYRKSFAFYTENNLLIAIMFYAANSMLFLGAFIIRYRLELILAFPLVAFVMAVYLSLSFSKDSAVQAPEKLYREPLLMVSTVLCVAVMAVLLFCDVPILYRLFTPSEIVR
jgi:4-hydroxybenzoate polyprenyltransferase